MVQDALDSLEFITGPPDSKWGSLRAAMGHPEPWAIQYMAIGNEVRALGGCVPAVGLLGPTRFPRRLRGGRGGSASMTLTGTARPLYQDCGKYMYLNNYLAFFGAISARYPHMRLISNCDMGDNAPTGARAGAPPARAAAAASERWPCELPW